MEDHYRVIYFDIFDNVVCDVQQRFDQPAYKVLSQIEHLLIESANSKTSTDNITELIRNLYSKDLDFDKLEGELLLLGGFVKQTLPGVKIVTSIDTIVSVLVNASNSTLMPNVKKLLQIFLLAPMSVATGERTFSVQRLVKTFNRSTMVDMRYNNLMILTVHKARTDALDLIDVAKQFVNVNDKRLNFFGKY